MMSTLPSRTERVEVAIVGGGPAGAAIAARLADAGHEVVLFERWPQPRWRAAGVYSSPQTRVALADTGLSPGDVESLLRPVPELIVETTRGATCRLVHDTEGPAVGVDRVRFERVMLDHAARRGATIREGALVRSVHIGTSRREWSRLVVTEGDVTTAWDASLVIGADGPRSLVARTAGVARRSRPILRAGLSVHRPQPPGAAASEPARLVFGRGWYVGITPVPRGRVNIGVVVSGALLRESADTGTLLQELVTYARSAGHVARAPNSDHVGVAYPLAYRVSRIAGSGFLLVGDAAGFIDPVSGEGIYRALSTAADAAEAVSRWRSGHPNGLAEYDERVRSRFRRKDVISWTLQAFMSRPELLDYAIGRLQRRTSVRRTFGQVMSDLAPPEAALNPRFLAALLAP